MTSPCCGFSLAVSGMMMPAGRLGVFLDALHDDAIVQWTELHGSNLMINV